MLTRVKELFDAGELGAAVEELTHQVKAKPGDAAGRTALFVMLCFAGDLDRAEKQLDALGRESVEREVGVQVYRNNVKAERARRRLFSEGLRPHFITEPPAYVGLHLSALDRLREGNAPAAKELLERAEEERHALAGLWGGSEFQDFRDYDDLVGPVLELVVKDRYTWLPFEQVGRLEIDAPKHLRDLVWAPARILMPDGSAGEVFIPALYAGSSDHHDDQVRLGRLTEWLEAGEGIYRGAGLRMFLVDGEARAMFEARAVEFRPAPPAAEPAAS
ncbi:MAG: avirulence locus temperature-dependent protein secretion protein [Acidobacteria bacterium]|nr:avirulence locus temperature-dependent protein secretion protein [Acidobacteriota bacterium]